MFNKLSIMAEGCVKQIRERKLKIVEIASMSGLWLRFQNIGDEYERNVNNPWSIKIIYTYIPVVGHKKYP